MLKFSPTTPDDVVRKANDVLDATRSERLNRGRPLRPVEWFATALKVCGEEVPDNPRDIIRAGLSARSLTQPSPAKSIRISSTVFAQCRTPSTES